LPAASLKNIIVGRKVRYDYRSDYESIADLALKYGGVPQKTHYYWCRWLHARADDIVTFRWPEISAVATALLERRRLTFADVRQTIDQHYGLKPFQ